jgi:uncharacterized protein YktB (UPF0637 family)
LLSVGSAKPREILCPSRSWVSHKEFVLDLMNFKNAGFGLGIFRDHLFVWLRVLRAATARRPLPAGRRFRRRVLSLRHKAVQANKPNSKRHEKTLFIFQNSSEYL